jgi:glycosyltransferase involved in cell wall biosynthesis
MSPVHVLQVLPELDPGGAERIVLSLARHLPAHGFRVSIAALDGRGTLAAEFKQLDCRVTDLGLRRRFALRAARRLREVIRRDRPTIVHSHLFRAHLASARAVRGTDVRITVATEHQADPRRWAMRLLRWTSRNTTAITAVSEDVRQHLVAQRFRPDRVHTLANGIEIAPIDQAAAIPMDGLGLPADAQVALFAGRLTRQKGLDILLRAMATLGPSHPDLHLLVAGEGDERASLQRLASQLALTSCVHFLGHREDVAGLMKTAHAAVMPSRWEGLSLVLLESMAAALPLVATNVAGHTELVTNGQTGLLVPPEDPVALAAAMKRLLEDRPRASCMAAAACDRVRSAFTAEQMAERYGRLYHKLLSTANV